MVLGVEWPNVLSWAIAGGIAGWLAYAARGAGRLGATWDVVGALVGALAGGFIVSPLAGSLLLSLISGRPHPPQQHGWWFSIPVAFVCALVAVGLVRVRWRKRPRP